MTSNKTTKRALLSSLAAMVLCCAMLIGTTFAWFTDTVSTGNNIIKSGILDVELIHNTQAGDVNVEDQGTDYLIFDYDKWEPGYTKIETLTVKNAGNLAFKFSLIPNIPTKTSDDDKTGASLADVIDVWVATDATAVTSTESFEDMKNSPSWRNAGSLASILADPDGMAWGVLLPVDGEGNALAGVIPEGLENAPFISVGSSTMTIALHMREEAGNDYQNLDLGDLYLTLEATQFTYEEDSFDQMYDEMAELDDWIYVYTGEQFKAALELTYPAKVKVMRDINVAARADISSEKVLDLNGYTVVDERAGGEIIWVKTGGALTIIDNSKDNTGTVIKYNHDSNMFFADDKLYIMEGTYKYTSYVWGECTKDDTCKNEHGGNPQMLGALICGRNCEKYGCCTDNYKGDVRIYDGVFDSGIQNPKDVVRGSGQDAHMMALLNCNENHPGAITVYGGKFIGSNPAFGDANDSNSDRGYAIENMFLEGQTAEMVVKGEVPATYTITHEIPTNGAFDMREYYIVEYKGN